MRRVDGWGWSIALLDGWSAVDDPQNPYLSISRGFGELRMSIHNERKGPVSGSDVLEFANLWTRWGDIWNGELEPVVFGEFRGVIEKYWTNDGGGLRIWVGKDNALIAATYLGPREARREEEPQVLFMLNTLRWS
jgi:hypothetical protein